MRKFGLIGYPLGHSFSKKYFDEKFIRESIRDCVYDLYPIESTELLNELLEDDELCGLNVTIPYKTRILDYLTDIEADARDVGAVNVIKVSGRGDTRKLRGFNSDIYGFRESILPYLLKYDDRAVILGTGGASKAVGYVFKTLGIEFVKVSVLDEPGCLDYSEVTGDLLYSHRIIVNATPLGMYPETDTFPDIPYHLLSKDNLLYDLVYNPELTMFLKKGREKGCRTAGGLKMLHLQAERSWEIWNDSSL